MKLLYPLLLFVGLAWHTHAQEFYFPPTLGGAWATTDPATLGYCSDPIDSLYEFLRAEQTDAFLLLKDGRIVLERYFGDYGMDDQGPWFSAGKSLKAILVGIAQETGELDIREPASAYLGMGWTSLPPEKEALITVRNQLTMTSGLDERNFTCTDPECLTYVTDAGERWIYHNGPYSLLRDVIEVATGVDLNIYTNQKVEAPTGMRGFWLASGPNNFYISTARDMARFGLLVLNEGIWDNQAVLSDTAYLRQMLTPSQSLNPAYGYLWWLNGQAKYIGPGGPEVFDGPLAPSAPEDLVMAAGAQGQFISVVPSQGLIMVRQGDFSEPDRAPLDLHAAIWAHISALSCTPTSTASPTADLEVEVFPNPAAEMVQIRTALSDYTVRMVNLSGQIVGEWGAVQQINLSGFSSGLYHLAVTSGERRALERLVVLPQE